MVNVSAYIMYCNNRHFVNEWVTSEFSHKRK